MAEDYVCTLDADDLRVAKEELGEDPKERLSQVNTLREWIEQQPHMTANTDTRILLPFLRTAKFSQLRARNMLEKSLQLRKDVPEWFDNIDTHDKQLKNFLASGYVVPLPGRLNGRKVILYRQGYLDLTNTKYDKLAVMRGMGASFQYFLKEEKTQVHGLMMLQDFSNTPAGLLTFFSIEDIKRITKMWEGSFPGRMKGFHYYNTGAVFEALMAISKPIMSKKLQSRIHVHGDNLEKVYKFIPQHMLPDEYLPDDYSGPSAGPLQELVDKFVQEITSPEVRDAILTSTSSKHYSINMAKKHLDVPQASFRKLAVD